LRRAIRSFRGRRRVSYDSKLEERFARDFRRVAPDWDLIREPEAVQAGDTLIFPDFALRHRGDGRRWLVEIVGFWTRDYLERKLALLRVAGLRDLVLCIDESVRMRPCRVRHTSSVSADDWTRPRSCA